MNIKALMEEKRGFALAGWCGSDACEKPGEGRDGRHEPQHSFRTGGEEDDMPRLRRCSRAYGRFR